VDAEINNVIYMELNSGPKMADGKYRKTDAGSVDRENTVLINHTFVLYASLLLFSLIIF
jgi:hypothetical protein